MTERERLAEIIAAWSKWLAVEVGQGSGDPASQCRPAPGGVHNHGPEEGPGVTCREYRIGACRLGTVDAERLIRAIIAVSDRRPLIAVQSLWGHTEWLSIAMMIGDEYCRIGQEAAR